MGLTNFCKLVLPIGMLKEPSFNIPIGVGSTTVRRKTNLTVTLTNEVRDFSPNNDPFGYLQMPVDYRNLVLVGIVSSVVNFKYTFLHKIEHFVTEKHPKCVIIIYLHVFVSIKIKYCFKNL